MAYNQNLVPIVIEKTGRGERAYDIYSSQVDDDSANLIVAQMLFLSNEDAKSEISFYINSPGGSITAGLGIYDTMQFLRCPVATYCIGQAASMGAVLFAAGAAGKRYLLPNSRVLIHQPLISGVLEGRATDLAIEAKEIIRMRKQLYEILSHHTGQPVEKIQRDSDRNLWLNSEESLAYGLADKILTKMPEMPNREEGNSDMASDLNRE
jgi:ATP-dependent Clp protease protease subunit